MTNDNFKHPCDNCRIAEEIIEAWKDGLCTANMCDGCFYNEYGCTEDEFYDGEIEQLWEEFGDIAFDENADSELVLAEDWLAFEAGTPQEDIWRWFDEQYSKGVHKLMFPND